MLRLKNGAMFGLDARIALAIFGALSVISGAALYGVIKKVKVQQFLSVYSEVQKAIEAYYLDTGSMLPHTGTLYYNANELLTSAKTGWKGPYLDFYISDFNTTSKVALRVKYLRLEIDADLVVIIQPFKDDQAYHNTSNINPACTSGPDCMIYIALYRPEIGCDVLDEIIDGTVDKGKGRLRSDADQYCYFNTGLNVDM